MNTKIANDAAEAYSRIVSAQVIADLRKIVDGAGPMVKHMIPAEVWTHAATQIETLTKRNFLEGFDLGETTARTAVNEGGDCSGGSGCPARSI